MPDPEPAWMRGESKDSIKYNSIDSGLDCQPWSSTDADVKKLGGVLSAQGTGNVAEFQKIFAAMRRDGYQGFVSIEYCSGKGEPQEAVKAGVRMLAELGT